MLVGLAITYALSVTNLMYYLCHLSWLVSLAIAYALYHQFDILCVPFDRVGRPSYCLFPLYYQFNVLCVPFLSVGRPCYYLCPLYHQFTGWGGDVLYGDREAVCQCGTGQTLHHKHTSRVNGRCSCCEYFCVVKDILLSYRVSGVDMNFWAVWLMQDATCRCHCALNISPCDVDNV